MHNGEINTIRGNVNWINAREGKAESPLFPDIKKVFPVVDDSGSDSAMFDNTFGILAHDRSFLASCDYDDDS